MEVNEAFEKLGYMKKWQILIFCLVIFMLVPTVVSVKYTFIFSGYIPKHHCKVLKNFSIVNWIPKDNDGNFESCTMFANSSVSNKTVSCTDGWEYDDADCGITIVNEWDLVCDNAYYAGFSHNLYVVGEMVAYCLLCLADIFGRKPISLIFLFLLSFTGVLNSFAGSYKAYALENFLIGVFTVPAATYTIILSEITSDLNRDFVVTSSYLCWGVYGILDVVLFYMFRTWRYFRFFTSIYGILVLPFLILFLPETVYWLHANNKIKEAEEILINAGKMNNIQFTTPILITPKINNELVKDKKYFEEKTFLQNTKTKLQNLFKKLFHSSTNLQTQYSIKELYRNKYLLRHMLFGLFLCFKATTLLGITYISPGISPYFYLNTFLSSLVEIPCGLIGWFIADKYSLKRMMIIGDLLTTILILSVPFFYFLADELTSNYASIILLTLAKFTLSAVWAFGYSYQSTLFPTNLRSRGVGICYVVSRFGVLISSYLPYMLTIHPVITYVVMGLCALISAVILFFLPDTKGITLPETIEDIEVMYMKKDKTKNTKSYEELQVEPKDSNDE